MSCMNSKRKIRDIRQIIVLFFQFNWTMYLHSISMKNNRYLRTMYVIYLSIIELMLIDERDRACQITSELRRTFDMKCSARYRCIVNVFIPIVLIKHASFYLLFYSFSTEQWRNASNWRMNHKEKSCQRSLRIITRRMCLDYWNCFVNSLSSTRLSWILPRDVRIYSVSFNRIW
jgi:hypothetical protein